jgi:signal transduction histidine kinase
VTARDDEAARRLLQLAEHEQQRILLDLHDGPVQYVYAALSQLDLLERAIDDADTVRARDRLTRARRLLESALDEIRGSLGTLRAPGFDTRDLRPLVEGLVLQHEAATDTEVSVAFVEPLPAAAVSAKIAIYRVLQEALSNAYRHGGARTVVVQLYPIAHDERAWLRLEVRDDGSGFESGREAQRDRFGIRGMHDRLAMLGGRLRIDSAVGSGTVVVAEVPAA